MLVAGAQPVHLLQPPLAVAVVYARPAGAASVQFWRRGPQRDGDPVIPPDRVSSYRRSRGNTSHVWFRSFSVT
jgi:hypothetical protein